MKDRKLALSRWRARIAGCIQTAISSDNTYYVKFRRAKRSATELMQYRRFPGGGPSSNTCPRCASHRAHLTSVSRMPKKSDGASLTFSFAIGAVKLGHPVPDAYLDLESKTAVPQQI